MSDQIKFTRAWGMPTPDTFDCEPIKGFVQKYLMKSKVSVDPFARNKRWATYTNDLNRNTAAEHHMEASEFLDWVLTLNTNSDLVIFDPPYNASQSKEMYESIGLKNTIENSQSGGCYSKEKDCVNKLLSPNGVFLWFGWNTCGMGKKRGFEIFEILLVSHGRGRNDTICTAERRITPHPQLF